MEIRRSIRTALTVGAFGCAVAMSQACGQFTSPEAANVAQSVGGTNQLTIVADNGNPATNQQLKFSQVGVSLSAQAVFSWSHSLTDATSGVQLQPCTSLNGNKSLTYVLQCAQAGKLSISLSIVDGQASYGPISMIEGVGVTLATPTPTPVPTPNPAGVALYASTCAGCHGGINSNNISSRTVSGLTNAIANIGAMRGISLTSTQEQEIVDALNGH